MAEICYLYGELKTSRKIASAIVKRRTEKPFATTGDLMEAVERLMPKERAKKRCFPLPWNTWVKADDCR